MTTSAIKLPPKGSFSSIYTSSPNSKPLDSKKSTPGKFSLAESPTKEHLSSSEFNDMFQYAQIALQKSCEVQEDIAKLFNLWELHEKDDSSELWNFLDKILTENGFKSIGVKPNLMKLAKILIDLVSEVNVLRQVMKSNEALETSSVINEDPNDQEGYNQTISYYKEYIRSLEEQLAFIKTRVSEFHEISLTQFNKDHRLIKEIQEAIEADEESEIISKIHSYKNIMKVVPNLEVFVEEVCREFVPEIVRENNYKSFSVALKEVFPRIKMIKKSLTEAKRFKERVYLALKIPSEACDEDVLEKIGSVVYFQKLFDVDDSEDIFGVMEQLFLYYRESKTTTKLV